MEEKKDPDVSVVAVNKGVRHEYVVLETAECGIKLTGSEVKSIRDGSISVKEAFGRIVEGQAWLYQMTIAPYPNSRFNLDPNRPRKLLLHRRELRSIHAEIKIKGRTWVPTRLYFKRGLLKVEMAICIGKKLYDKRQSMKKADARREIERAMTRKG